jgi:hypothetical protein
LSIEKKQGDFDFFFLSSKESGKGVMGRMLGLMNRGGIDRLGPSKFSLFI